MKPNRYLTPLPLLLLLSLTLPAVAGAQSALSGKDFWLAFPQNARFERFAGERFSVFITGEAGTKGSVMEFADGKQRTFSIPESGVAEVTVDTTAELVQQGPHKAAVHVSATGPVNIVAVSYRPASMDSYSAIPTPLLGREYAVIGYDSIPGLDHYHTQCDVIATEDGTTVTISYPSRLTDARLIRSATLTEGEVLHLGGDNAPPDITGAIINASNPVAVVTGHTCAQVPSNVFYCDLLMEMIPSVDKLGSSFAIVPFKWQQAASLRVVAVEDNTVVKLGGKVVATIDRGNYYQNDDIKQASLLETGKPAYAVEYMHGSDDSHDSFAAADPSMVALIPTERMANSVRSVVPTIHPGGGTTAPDDANATWQDWLNVVVRKSDLSSLRLNGKPLTIETAMPLEGSDLVAATVMVRQGMLELNGAPFAAYSYGLGRKENAFESYAHALGMNLR